MNQAASSSEAPLYNAPALVAYADALLQQCGLAAPMAASVARTLVAVSYTHLTLPTKA